MNLCFASLPPVSSWNYSCMSTNRCSPPPLCQMSTGVLGFGGTVPRYKMSAEDKDLAKRFFADRFMRLQDQVQTRTHAHPHTLTLSHAHTCTRTHSSRLFLWNYKKKSFTESTFSRARLRGQQGCLFPVPSSTLTACLCHIHFASGNLSTIAHHAFSLLLIPCTFPSLCPTGL